MNLFSYVLNYGILDFRAVCKIFKSAFLRTSWWCYRLCLLRCGINTIL